MLHPSVPVTFEERDVTAARPACIPLLAVAMAHGWRLVNDGYPNHVDVLTGVKHLRDFRHADAQRVRRFIHFRFVQREIRIEGDLLRLEQFLQRCREDEPFFRAAQHHPDYRLWLDQLADQLPRAARHLAPTEHHDHGRELLVPIGGDPALMHLFDRLYQTTW